jgi:SAM-dependent methyltransferase
MTQSDTFDMLFGLRRDSFFYKGRKKIIASLLNKSFRNAVRSTENFRIADIGSGHGSILLLDTLKDSNIKNATVTGIDIDLPTLSKIKGMGVANTNFVNANIMKLPFKRSFDMVLLLDVLEHVDDDSGLLGNIYNICNDGALLVMTVPAMSKTYSEFDKLASHKRRYDLPDLREKLSKSGFKVYKISYYIFFLMPVIYLFKSLRELLIRMQGKKVGIADVAENKTIPVINELCLSTLLLESALINKLDFPFGSSIVAIAGKGLPR